MTGPPRPRGRGRRTKTLVPAVLLMGLGTGLTPSAQANPDDDPTMEAPEQAEYDGGVVELEDPGSASGPVAGTPVPPHEALPPEEETGEPAPGPQPVAPPTSPPVAAPPPAAPPPASPPPVQAPAAESADPPSAPVPDPAEPGAVPPADAPAAPPAAAPAVPPVEAPPVPPPQTPTAPPVEARIAPPPAPRTDTDEPQDVERVSSTPGRPDPTPRGVRQPPASTPQPALEPVAVAGGGDPSYRAPEPTRAPVAEGRTYVVQPGDTLWSLAHSLLGPGASTEAVAALVERLWEVNRAAIASGDPDLIQVGEVLRLP